MFKVVQPAEMPVQEKLYMEQHLSFSAELNEMWHRGDAMVEGIFNRKRCLQSKRRVINDPFLRRIISVIRKFRKYEALRSSMEGLLFEQVPYLNEPCEMKFKITGNPNYLKMTHVYFSCSFWEFNQYEKESFIDKGEELTEGDLAFITAYFRKIAAVMDEITVFVNAYRGRDRLGWRICLMRSVQSIKRAQQKITGDLMRALEQKMRDD